MKRFVLPIAFLLVSILSAAQSVVTGVVVDKNGEPVPNARVEAVGTTNFCLTNLDGVFTLYSASEPKKLKVMYIGLQPKTVIASSDMTIHLARTNIWNAVPYKYRWFLLAQGAFPYKELGANFSNPSLGLMFGCVKHLGGYVKVVGNRPTSSRDYFYGIEQSIDIEDVWTTGRTETSFYSATCGMVFRLGCPVHLYVGLGWSYSDFAMELNDNGENKFMNVVFSPASSTSYSCGIADAGFIVMLNHFTLNAGVQITSGAYKYCIGNIGVGYRF